MWYLELWHYYFFYNFSVNAQNTETHLYDYYYLLYAYFIFFFVLSLLLLKFYTENCKIIFVKQLCLDEKVIGIGIMPSMFYMPIFLISYFF